MSMSVQEVATCCRVAFKLWSGAVGPQYAQVNLDTLFVRDEDFWLQLSRELSMDASELWAANKAADEQRVEYRKLRSECVEIGAQILGVCSRLKNMRGERWRFFEKMLKGQTVRQIVRRVSVDDKPLVGDSCTWCADQVVQQVGEGQLEKMLTLRTLMA